MTKENWQLMKIRMRMRRRKEQAIVENVKDGLTVLAGVGVVLLMCGFCWVGGM